MSAAVCHRPAWQWQQAETRGSRGRTTPAFPAKSRGGPHPGTSTTSGAQSEPPLSVHPHPILSTERSHPLGITARPNPALQRTRFARR
jgi:hypothetical protein